jgi:Ca2+-binding EF-hand superfamily protein
VFAFKDPRLRHLNKGFKREELQVSFIQFNSPTEQIKQALDEIIKFNCMTLEFNYMHDLFQCLGNLAIERTGSYDWGGLFSFYDKNHDNLLDKNELRGMVINCGPTFAEATEAEV